MTDPFASSTEPIDPHAKVHAPTPTVGQPSSIALDEPPTGITDSADVPIVSRRALREEPSATSSADSPPTALAAPPSAPTTTPVRARPQRRLPPLPPAFPLLVTAVVLFAAAIGFLVLIAVDPSGGKTHQRRAVASSTRPSAALIAPTAIGKYQQVSAPASVRTGLVAMFDKAAASTRSKITPLVDQTAVVAAYTSGRQDTVVLEAYRTSAIPAGSSPIQELSALYLGAGKKFTTYTFKKTDIVRCGTTRFLSKPASLCLWQDPKSIGAVIGATAPADLSALAEAARETLEK